MSKFTEFFDTFLFPTQKNIQNNQTNGEEEKINPFVDYFKKLWNNIVRFFAVNIIYFIFTLPLIFLIYNIYYIVVFNDLVIKQDGSLPITSLFFLVSFISNILPDFLNIALVVISVICFGPITAGCTYFFKCVATGKDAYISDIFIKAKENFLKAFAIGLIDIFAFLFLIFNIFFPQMGTFLLGEKYLNNADAFNQMFILSKYASLIAVPFYYFARHYFYTLLITFKMTLKEIYKNSFIYSIVGLWRNFLISIINIALGVVCIMLSTYTDAFLLTLILMAIWGYTTIFVAYPVVKRFMIDIIEKNPEIIKIDTERKHKKKPNNPTL